MDKKSKVFVGIFGLFLISLFNILPLISAYTNAGNFLAQGASDVIEMVKGFSSPFFEVLLNTSAYSEFFFAKCLLLILLFIIVYYVLRSIDFLGLNQKKGVLLIITSVMSILALRYLPENNFILAILLPYNALGLAVTIFLPFLIYFFFVEKSIESSTGRRAAWILYAVIFGVLWYNRADELSRIANYVYLAGLVVVILALIFDKSWHRYFAYADFRKGEEETRFWNKIKLQKQLEELQDAFTKGRITENEYEKKLKLIEDRVRMISS